MSRLPIRLRLTLVFTAALAAVLAAAGLLLYQRLEHSLDRTLDQGLRVRAADVAALVAQADSGLRESPANPFASGASGFAQVFDARGRIFDATPGLGRAPLVSQAQLAVARRRPLLIGRSRRDGQPVGLLALATRAQDQRLVIVVGTSLQSRDGALSGLRRELLTGGPLALVLVSVIGYAVAAAALRPVERMRARAEALSASRLHDRLPVPRADDELSRLGTTLNDLLERLETSLARQQRFVADASHELRTPLALMQAEIELALDRPRSKAELEAALRSAAEEVDRLSQLAGDLLLLARLDKGALVLRTEPTEVDDLLAGIVARFGRRASSAGRRLLAEGGGHRVRADRLRLEQALANLVDNALRHGSGDVRLIAAERADRIELHVVDDGRGFPPTFLPRAFERFSRAEEARARGGTGLGLAIVAEVAAAHGGAAGAVNRPTGGTDVWLSIAGSSERPDNEQGPLDAGPVGARRLGGGAPAGSTGRPRRRSS